jgi:hypothetical protein
MVPAAEAALMAMAVEQIEAELAQARRAQAAGNLGQARVCARRAAGIALRARFGRAGDALKQLKLLEADLAQPESVRAAARRLSTKVDEHHQLPFTEDPLDDAQLIIAHLTPQPPLPTPPN